MLQYNPKGGHQTAKERSTVASRKSFGRRGTATGLVDSTRTGSAYIEILDGDQNVGGLSIIVVGYSRSAKLHIDRVDVNEEQPAKCQSEDEAEGDIVLADEFGYEQV